MAALVQGVALERINTRLKKRAAAPKPSGHPGFRSMSQKMHFLPLDYLFPSQLTDSWLILLKMSVNIPTVTH